METSLVLLFMLLSSAPEPRLELRAQPAVLYPGQLGQLEVVLRVPLPAPADVKPPRLSLPWLEMEIEGLEGRLMPDAWLTSTLRQHGDGMPIQLGRGTWNWPQDPARSTATESVHRMVWRCRVRPEQEGPIRVPAAETVWPDGRKLASAPLKIEIKPLPLPTQPLPAWRLGVGAFTVRSELAPSTLRPGEEAELRLWVGGDGALEEIKPPPLARLPGWGLDRFRVTPAPETWSDDLKQRCFRWRVQIRGEEGPVALPPIPFSFFDPRRGQYVVSEVPRLPATLAPREPTAADKVTPLAEVPERLRLASPEAVLAVPLDPRHLLIPIAGGILLVELIACLFLGRRYGWPGAPAAAVRRAEIRRAWKAGRRALQDERLPLPLRAEAALRLIGMRTEAAEPATPKLDELRRRTAALRRAAEAARYGPPNASAIDLRAETAALLDDWKEAACS